MKQKSIYIAGPMSGYPEFNFPVFNAMAEALRFIGWNVINPAEHGDQIKEYGEHFATGDYLAGNAAGFDIRKHFLWDVEQILNSDAIFMLNGWEKSKGAVAEHAVAEFVKKQVPAYEIYYESEVVADTGIELIPRAA